MPSLRLSCSGLVSSEQDPSICPVLRKTHSIFGLGMAGSAISNCAGVSTTFDRHSRQLLNLCRLCSRARPNTRVLYIGPSSCCNRNWGNASRRFWSRFCLSHREARGYRHNNRRSRDTIVLFRLDNFTRRSMRRKGGPLRGPPFVI